MANMMKRTLSLVIAMTMLLSLPLTAMAEETAGTVEVETSGGKTETVDVTITIEKTENPDGSVTTQTQSSASGAVTESGKHVNYESSSNMTQDADGTVTGTAQSDYTVGGDYYYAEGGSDLTLEEQAPDVTVDVPLEGGSATAEGRPAGTTIVTGDVREDENDGIYDYTTETVVKPGSASVENVEVNVTEGEASAQYQEKEGLDYVINETDPTSDNDLSSSASHVDLDEAKDKAGEIKEGYQLVYVGDDDTSQFWAAYLYTEPQLENELPIYTLKDEDGNVIQEYYIGRKASNGGVYNAPKSYYIEGIYLDGERVNDDETGARWDSIQSFVLVDAKGNVVTAYCADQMTPTVEGFNYKIENVEDADYYNDEQAAMIRTVALNGYWGTQDDPSTEETEIGSLESVKKMMREARDADGNPVFTDTEINSLTDGVAMTATQYAIWTFSREMDDIVFLNTQYIPKDANNEYDLGLLGTLKPGGGRYDWADFLLDVPSEKQGSVDLLFKLYNHLIHMDPTTVEDPSTANTIINPDNFVTDMDITVIKKAEDHVNNQDSDKTNDAYVTDLSFALVVAPSTENGDDMVVKVLGSDGEVIATARLAGEADDGLEVLTPDEQGNYCFRNITLTEGTQTFNISLEGIQHLDEGVYLYTSEVRVEDEEEVSSQTLVGLAGGDHALNVSMNISFDLDVEDEVVAKEHVWRTEDHLDPPTLYHEPPTDPPNDPPSDEEIPDEEVPLAQAPETGDGTLLLAALSLFAAAGLFALNMPTTKRRTF